MLLLIYKNGTTLFKDDDGYPVHMKTDIKIPEVIVTHEDDLTRGQIISKQKQMRVVHTFAYVAEAHGYYIYMELE